jgi:hypothetical protein
MHEYINLNTKIDGNSMICFRNVMTNCFITITQENGKSDYGFNV